jgi:hypothetical protein
MAIPLKGNRLIAKVLLSLYVDSACAIQMPPVPPGPAGLRKSFQLINIKDQDSVIGTYTGNDSEIGYEVEVTLQYQVAIQKLFRWDTITVTKPATMWVKKDQVTGFWDTGVDAPVVKVPVIETKTDNTNVILGGAIAVALIFKKLKGE